MCNTFGIIWEVLCRVKKFSHPNIKINMKTNRTKLWMTTLVAFLSFAAVLTGCKKDDYVVPVSVCPVVASTNPLSNAVNVPLNQVISATFNEKMDPASFSQASFTIDGILKSSISGTVSYNVADSTMKFTPSSKLALATTYTCIVKATVKDLNGNVLQADYRWAFSTGPVVAPIVTLTDPLVNATNVPMNKIITATFSIPMDASTITASTFTVKAGATAVAGMVTYAGLLATFTPSANLLPNTLYTGTITIGALNADGTALQANYVWTFTTSGVPPTVVSTDPVNNATGVLTNKIIRANFSVAMNPLTITSTTFTLKQGATGVAGTVTYLGTRASFTPNSALALNTVYTATITTGAMNAAGTPILSDYVWSFTTSNVLNPAVSLTDPLNNAVNVALNKQVKATFNMPMDPSTLTSTTFTVKAGATIVSGMVTYAGSTATFTPDVDLITGTTYTATITTGAKNPAAVAISGNYVWNFSTGPAIIIPPGAVNLGSADQFGILAGVGVSNAAGLSQIINLNVGIYPGFRSSVTGFPPAVVIGGAIYAADDIAPPGVGAMLNQAKLDLVAAYLAAEGAVSPAPQTVAGDQGGKTLAPGIYKSTSTLLIQNGDLTLDAQGDANAVWIFQVASAFTTIGGAGGDVILTGGAQAKNVYWQTGSSAVIGDYTDFQGNILALQSITMNAYSKAVGRMLAQNGSVVMTSTNTITKP